GKAEDRAVGADANSQREDSNDREARVLCQHPAAIVQVTREIAQPRQPALIAQGLHRLREAGRSDVASVSRRQFKMHAELTIQIAVAPCRTKRAPETTDPLTQRRHG